MGQTQYDQDATELVERIQKVLNGFRQASGLDQMDESFVAVDSVRYKLVIKLKSPFGNGQVTESLTSTNELQQRINYWLAIQRDLGQLAAVRMVVTPSIDEDED